MTLYLVAAALLVLLAIDWRQTLVIARDPQRRESNPILGARPSVARVHAYFALVMLPVVPLVLLLPGPVLLAALAFVCGIEALAIVTNHRHGIRI